MKKILLMVWTCMLIASVSSTPIRAQVPGVAGPAQPGYIILNGYVTTGSCKPPIVYLNGVKQTCGYGIKVQNGYVP